MDDDTISIRLDAQRALLACVPHSLRAFSVELDKDLVSVRSIFDETVTESEKELLREVGTEILAEYRELFTIEEEIFVLPVGQEMTHLTTLIFLRYEP